MNILSTCWFSTTFKGEQVRILCEDRPDAAWLKGILRDTLGLQCTSTEDGHVALSPRETEANRHYRELAVGD